MMQNTFYYLFESLFSDFHMYPCCKCFAWLVYDIGLSSCLLGSSYNNGRHPNASVPQRVQTLWRTFNTYCRNGNYANVIFHWVIKASWYKQAILWKMALGVHQFGEGSLRMSPQKVIILIIKIIWDVSLKPNKDVLLLFRPPQDKISLVWDCKCK